MLNRYLKAFLTRRGFHVFIKIREIQLNTSGRMQSVNKWWCNMTATRKPLSLKTLNLGSWFQSDHPSVFWHVPAQSENILRTEISDFHFDSDSGERFCVFIISHWSELFPGEKCIKKAGQARAAFSHFNPLHLRLFTQWGLHCNVLLTDWLHDTSLAKQSLMQPCLPLRYQFCSYTLFKVDLCQGRAMFHCNFSRGVSLRWYYLVDWIDW